MNNTKTNILRDTNEFSVKEKMLSLAEQASKRAYAPYSGFYVGACLLAASGKYYCGCNIENAAYSPTNCAERTALFTAVYEGERAFTALAVYCSGQRPSSPCGVCRQALSEFCAPDMKVYMGCASGQFAECTLGELLPFGFGKEDLQ